MNSRLSHIVDCISQIVAYCVDNDVDLVLFGGDLFHVRRTINVQAFNAVYSSLRSFSEVGVPVAAIHGNHDQANRSGTLHSLQPLQDFITVIDEPGWVVLQGRGGEYCAVLGVPYTENVEHLRDIVQEPSPDSSVHKIMLGHFGVQGAKVGADFVYTNPHDPSVGDMNCSGFDRVYLGHYHLHQQIAPSAWYIGAPLQHNWGDRDQFRGFVVYDTNKRTHELVSCAAPKFVYTSCDSDQVFDDCFVRIRDSRLWSSDEVVSKRKSLQACSLEIVPEEQFVKDESKPRLAVTPNTSFKESMEQYVLSGLHPTDGLEESYLLQLGNDILMEIENGKTES